jgi:hypothetical protein
MSRSLRVVEPQKTSQDPVRSGDVVPVTISAERVVLRLGLYVGLASALLQTFANEGELARTPALAAMIGLAGLACSARK